MTIIGGVHPLIFDTSPADVHQISTGHNGYISSNLVEFRLYAEADQHTGTKRPHKTKKPIQF